MNPEVVYCEDPHEAAEAAAALLLELETEALAERGVFRIALSGGSTPKLLFQKLASAEWRAELDFSNWDVFWSDERAVPPDHPDSNFRLAHENFLSRVPVGDVFRMPAELDNREEAADSYARTLKARFLPEPVAFDCLLLGLGADGHTASLFPGSPALESGALVEAVEVPGHPIPRRLTFTLRVINRARAAVFLVCGEDKARALKRVLRDEDHSLPATRVHPLEGRLIWIVDEAAASELA